MPKLNNKEIGKRLTRLDNLERLYPIARQRIELLEKENKALKAHLAEVVATYDGIIEKLKLRIEELEKMVFGSKRKKSEQDNQSIQKEPPQRRHHRETNTYRRAIPQEQDITETNDYPVSHCPLCSHPLQEFKWIIRYQQDIKLLEHLLKKVEKQRIQTGYCPKCHKRAPGIPVSKQVVSLGPTLKQFICYCNVILRLSFEQTRHLIRDLAHLEVSDGEISCVLSQQSQLLLPHYQRIQDSIRGQPVAHYDETSWRVQKEYQGRWAWLMTGGNTTDAIFRLGQSRGQGNALALQGNNQEQVAVTDDYGAYRKIFKYHQLCWAHILRKTKDLVNSSSLSPDKKSPCLKTYQALSALHLKLKKTLEKPFDIQERKVIHQTMRKQLAHITRPDPIEPVNLQTIKQSLLKNKDKYFTCLLFKDVPTTNNKAERALRHLVLKRKSSFGSKTQKGAWIMSILYSVLLSLWWSKPKNFFQEYSLLLNPV